MAKKNRSCAMNHLVGRARLSVLAALLVLPAGPFAHADGLQAGMWRLLNKPVINGVSGPDQQTTRCLTPAAVADLDKTFSPVSRTTNSSCELVEHEATPQRLKWHLQCTGQMNSDVVGEFVFDAPEHYTATISTKASMAGRQIQDIQVTIEATRVGECQ
jgi:hypothetical protein